MKLCKHEDVLPEIIFLINQEKSAKTLNQNYYFYVKSTSAFLNCTVVLFLLKAVNYCLLREETCVITFYNLRR